MNTNRGIVVITLIVTLAGPCTTAFGQEQPLDLSAFIALVEKNSLALEAARTERSLAAVQERVARSQLYPTIVGQLGYARNLLDVEQPVPAYADSNNPREAGIYPIGYENVDVNKDNGFTLGFSLQQKLFDMTVFRALEASGEYITLTDTAFEATRQGIVTEAKRLYYLAILLNEVLAVRRSSQEIAHDSFVNAQMRFRNGVASRIEVLTAEVNWKMTQPNTTQAERNLQIALQNLKNLAGLPLEAELRLAGDLESFPPPPGGASTAMIQTRRPDYRVLLNQRRLRELAISAKRDAFFPSLNASVVYGWQAASDEFNISDSTDTLSLGVALNVPILYGGSRFPMLRQAKLELEQTNNQIAQKEADIFTELENIRLTLLEANQRIGSAKQTQETAKEAYGITRGSVESGLATQLELKDARVSLEQARLGHLSAVFDYLSAYFDWQRATGQGAEL